ncbi:MAG: hypothetical protein NWE83_09245 [Candidatus Bathyarchaeota archaeon]|jgi:hypothetical protein|nr:hypothetical protein [Candidatus Bathyarchaeota archaeon]
MSQGFPEKMDALDLIINALKDHEKRLDEISHQLQNVLQDAVPHTPELEEAPSHVSTQKTRSLQTRTTLPRIQCSDWREFLTQFKHQKATLVTYHIDEHSFTVNSMTDDFVLMYTEPLPQKRLQVTEDATRFSFNKETLDTLDLLEIIINRRLKCGLALAITSQTVVENGQQYVVLTFTISPTAVKNFLNKQLGIPKKNIVAGNIIP